MLAAFDTFEAARDFQMDALGLPFDKRIAYVESALAMLGVSESVGKRIFLKQRRRF